MQNSNIPVVAPWRRVAFDPLDGGAWVVAGDLNGDGVAEIVTARNVDANDVHYTCTVAAYALDGTRLWRWGGAGAGRAELHHDVACQLHDWDGDGRLEVLLCDEHDLVVLDGATGVEQRRLPLPAGATDCLVCCNLSGHGATDILVKTRYSDLWAFDRDWQLLWHVQEPGGHHTAHQPYVLDIDGDGRDEVMAGRVLLNPDGTTRWQLKPDPYTLDHHLDCMRVVHRGAIPREWRLAFTYCNSHILAMCDGEGSVLWALTGEHFESIDVGCPRPDLPGLQLLVDIDKKAAGDSPLWVVSEDGEPLDELLCINSRHHRLFDWTGTGIDSIVVGVDAMVFDGHGQPQAKFDIDPRDAPLGVHTADITGNGIADILLGTAHGTAAYVFTAAFARRRGRPPLIPGTGINVTLY